MTKFTQDVDDIDISLYRKSRLFDSENRISSVSRFCNILFSDFVLKVLLNSIEGLNSYAVGIHYTTPSRSANST